MHSKIKILTQNSITRNRLLMRDPDGREASRLGIHIAKQLKFKTIRI